MKRILRIAFIFMVTVFFSCEKQGLFVKCQDCTADEPLKTNLEFKVDFSYSGLILIRIYEGKLNDSILIKTFEPRSSPWFDYEVTVNKEYTATATYYISDNRYVAVDSATPRVKYDKSQCDDPCYFVYDRIVDLRLKFIK
jgi:hypothetical protein